jgi:DNA-directed RNA polymerase specialized sigma24 family protein
MSDWTARERRDVIRSYHAGMALGEIADMTKRTVGSIYGILRRSGVALRARQQRPPMPRDDRAIALAKEDVAWESACIRAERTSAPVFRIRPEEWP